MSASARRQAFAGVVVLVIGVWALLAVLGRREGNPSTPRRPAAVTASGGRPTIVGQTDADARDPTPSAARQPTQRAVPRPAPDLARAQAAARRFVRAFLRYEVGAVDGSVRRELRRTASPALAGDLIADPPRLASGHRRRAQLVDLVTLDPRSPVAVLAARIDRAGRVGVLTVTVERRSARWRVTSVR